MSENIVEGVTSTSNFIVDILVGVTSFFANILGGIGMKEIFIFVLIGIAIYYWANQHSLSPIRINPKF